MNRLVLIVLICNLICIYLPCNHGFDVIEFVIQVEQGNIGNLGRRISGVGETRDILYIGDDFNTDKFAEICENLAALLHNSGVRMTAIKNTVEIFVVSIVLIADINGNFRITCMESQRFCGDHNATIIDVKIRFRLHHGSEQIACNIGCHLGFTRIDIQGNVSRQLLHIDQQIIDGLEGAFIFVPPCDRGMRGCGAPRLCILISPFMASLDFLPEGYCPESSFNISYSADGAMHHGAQRRDAWLKGKQRARP